MAGTCWQPKTRLRKPPAFAMTKSGMEDGGRTVLHVCPDQELAGSREVLIGIGCQVFWVRNEGAALFEISLGRCRILLLCHLLFLDETSYLRCANASAAAVQACQPGVGSAWRSRSNASIRPSHCE